MIERLQKILARAGYGSRRQNEEMIKNGRVKVNGSKAKVGDKADPRRDKITVDDHPIPAVEQNVYIIVHKPRGIISDDDDLGRKTVRDMVPVDGHLYPVGRLDKESMGLILLTNDGWLANRLTHPRYRHEKVYRVKIEGSISNPALAKWRRGVLLEGEEAKTLPASVKVTDRDADHTWLEITMREGKKRQIRRVAAQLGHPVRHLSRIQIGPIRLGELELGRWRHLSDREVERLRKYVTRKKSGAPPSSGNQRGRPQKGGRRRSTPSRGPKRRR